MARFGNSNGLSVKSSFLEPKCGQKSQIWPPCDQIALANWIIYMNLHFKQRKIFACGGDRPTILSVSQLLSVKHNVKVQQHNFHVCQGFTIFLDWFLVAKTWFQRPGPSLLELIDPTETFVSKWFKVILPTTSRFYLPI